LEIQYPDLLNFATESHKEAYWVCFYSASIINDLPLVLKLCKCIMYADDVILCFSGKTKSEVEEKIKADFNAITEWADLNGMEISLSKTKTMLLCPLRMAKPENLRIGLGDAYSECVDDFKYLGLWLDPKLSFDGHVTKFSPA